MRIGNWKIRRCKERAIVFAAIFASLLAVSGAVVAQVPPPPLATPNLDLLGTGSVYAIARQPDGGAIVGGRFTSVDGQPRQNIARRKADGVLDVDWNPLIDGPVRSISIDSTGAIYIAGTFTTINGQNRSGVAKLTAAGELDSTWNPDFHGFAFCVTVADDGYVFFGGSFQVTPSTGYMSLVKLSGADATPDPQWIAPIQSGTPYSFAIDGDWLYVGGFFQTFGGLERRNLGRVSRTGAGLVDANWAPQTNGSVHSIALGAGDAVFVGGGFSYAYLQPRSGVAKISRSGTGVLDLAWNPVLDLEGISRTVATDAAGQVYVGSRREHAVGELSPAHTSIARFSQTGTGAVDPDWTPAIDGSVLAINVASNGNIDIGGTVSSTSSTPLMGLATIDAAGVTTRTIDIEAQTATVAAIAFQPDGSTVIGGRFMKADGQLRRNLVRLLPDGSLDATWNPATNGDVVSVATTTDGTVLAGGSFTQANGHPRIAVVKLAGGGTGIVDGSWASPIATGIVTQIAMDRIGNGSGYDIYVGGDFQTLNQNVGHLARLENISGALDTNWIPAPNDVVNGLIINDQQQVFVSGPFTSIGGAARNSLAKLPIAGSGNADPLWNTPLAAGTPVDVIALSGASLYAAGRISIPGTTLYSQRVVRFDTAGTGSADQGWNPNDVNSGEILAMAVVENDGLYTSERRQNTLSPPITYFYRTAKFRIDDAGSRVTPWWQSLHGQASAVVVRDNTLYLGGGFTRIDNQARLGIAAFSIAPSDAIFSHGFE